MLGGNRAPSNQRTRGSIYGLMLRSNFGRTYLAAQTAVSPPGIRAAGFFF
jgi:hypothetical protein